MAAFSFEAKAVACPSDLSFHWRVTNGRTITKERKPDLYRFIVPLLATRLKTTT